MSALSAALAVPWAIRPEVLKQLLDIAGRAHTPDFDAAARRMAERQNEINSLALTPGVPLAGTGSVKMRGSVAVLPVEGPLFRYGNLFTSMSGASSMEMLAKDFRVALNDPDVSAILMHVDSPGGEVNGTGEFADHIFAARGIKPIWAYVSNEGASAAYWIASACDRIVCAPTSIIGSIGVVAAIPDPSADDGRRIQFVSSQSPNKRPDPKSEEGKATIQVLLDDLADQFIYSVARNRNVSTDFVLSDFGAGGVFVGKKAVEAGLADSIGNFEECLVAITKPSSLKGGAVATSSSASNTALSVINVSTRPSDVSPSSARDGVNGETTTPSIRKGRRQMNFKDRLLAAISGVPDEELEDEGSVQQISAPITPPVAAPVAAVVPSHIELRARQLEEQNARLQDQLTRVKMERVHERAESFWGALLDSHRAVPSEQAGIIEGYTRAAMDDEVLPLADGSTRVDKFESMYRARPANMLMAESVPDALNEVIMLRNKLQSGGSLNGRTPEGQPMKDDRKKDLLGMTDLGKQVLNQRNGRTN